MAPVVVAPAPIALVGVLEIHVMECEYKKRGLGGIFNGLGNDPYCRVRIGTSTSFKTRIYKGVDKGTRAAWFEKFTYHLNGPINLQFEVLDEEEFTPDSLIGMAKLDINATTLFNGQPQWLSLSKRCGATIEGRFQVALTLRPHVPVYGAPVYTAPIVTTQYVQQPIVTTQYVQQPVVYQQPIVQQRVVYQSAPVVIQQQPTVSTVYYR